MIRYFEEKFYFIEIFQNDFSYTQTKFFLEFIESTLTFTNNSDIQNSWYATWTNPLKILILIFIVWLNLSDRFPNLNSKFCAVKNKLLMLAKESLNVDSSLNEVERLLKDKWYNKYEVIDLISDNCIYELLAHPNWEMLIQSYWDGPYLNKSFMHSSFCYNMVFDQTKNELEYTRVKVNSWQSKVIFCESQSQNMLIYLCIKTGNNSIKLFFIVDSIFIIIWTIIVLWFFEITQKLITWIVDRQEDIQYDLESLRSGNLSDLQIVSTKIDLIANITKINEWSVTILIM